ncbi:Type 1 glutamine amidotransferase-like domain-containing protein [Candidatus Nomurabacteria bacterium]|nr:Type 1 glutamine amidotransferase-like domain-containing protein [Candidatus Nomurabacteria bacterium]
MKYYFSSFKIGDEPKKLKSLLPDNPQAVYISNGLDFASPEGKKKHQDWDLRELKEIGIVAEPLDLREYFGKQNELRNKLEDVDLIYVSGGNVYDLRIAIHLSGFDQILCNDLVKTDKVYAGYSAAVCVLSPTLKGYHIVDKPDNKLYGDHETLWDGLGLIDWQFAPHFNSDHSESEDINQEIAYYEEHNMKYRSLKDGDVIIE